VGYNYIATAAPIADDSLFLSTTMAMNLVDVESALKLM
jgi:hypothetical protein